MATMPTRGVCRYCGCTDDRACPGGCAWVDTAHTKCSACLERYLRAWHIIPLRKRLRVNLPRKGR